MSARNGQMNPAVSGARIAPRSALTSVMLGNSIAANGQWAAAVLAGASGGYPSRCEYAIAEKFFPLSQQLTRLVAGTANSGSTSWDIYGNYGYAGASSSTILADLGTNWFARLDAAGIVPDLVSIPDIFCNDVLQDAAFATIKARAQALFETLASKWPGVIIECNTPHPSDLNTTASRKSAFHQTSDWLLTQHDGANLLITDLRDPAGYSDPLDRSLPISGYYFNNVHPEQTGASLNGKLIAATRKRAFGGVPPFSAKPFKSAALGMLGSSSVATTGFIGTRPTGWGTPTPLSSAGECVCTAGNPGAWNLVWTPTSIATQLTLQLTNTSSLPTGDIQGWAKVRINSGASNIGYLGCNFQQQNAGGATKNFNELDRGSSWNSVYANGDVLYLKTPATANAGTLTGIYPTIYLRPIAVGAPIDIDVLAAGYIDRS